MGTAPVPVIWETSQSHVLPGHNRLCHDLQRVRIKLWEQLLCSLGNVSALVRGEEMFSSRMLTDPSHGEWSRASDVMLLSWGQDRDRGA